MADEFSTPINKIQGVSTREEGAGQAEPLTYEDILRQQAQPQREADPQPAQMPQMSQMPMQQVQPMNQMQPMQPMQQMQPPPQMQPPSGYAQSEYDDDEYDRPHRPRREYRDDPPHASQTPWILTKWRRHKTDIVFALAMFATLTVIIPRLRRMPRFSEGIPMLVMGIVSVIMGCLANTVSMSV